MADINEIFSSVKPRQQTIRVCMRGDLIDTQRGLERELQEVRREDERRNRKPQAPAIAKKIEALQKEAEEHTFEFVFQAIGQRKWNDLIAKNPPTAEQKKLAKQNGDRIDFDLEKFPIKAIAATAVSPEMTVEDVTKLYDVLNYSQWNLLWTACVEANVGDSSVPKSMLASQTLGPSTKRSERASASESLAQSSLVE